MLSHLQYSLSPSSLGGAILVLFILYKISYKLYINARLRKLGARAPVRRSYLPYGVDMAYELVKHVLADQNYEFWVKMFAEWAPGRWTLEAGIGERVVLTAEPENIKAILATQFKDYGKGEVFHKEWYLFLGNGGSCSCQQCLR